jgi:hypothetical protein
MEGIVSALGGSFDGDYHEFRRDHAAEIEVWR